MATTIRLTVEKYRNLFVHVAYGFPAALAVFWHEPIELRDDIAQQFSESTFNIVLNKNSVGIKPTDEFVITFDNDADAILFKLIYM